MSSTKLIVRPVEVSRVQCLRLEMLSRVEGGRSADQGVGFTDSRFCFKDLELSQKKLRGCAFLGLSWVEFLQKLQARLVVLKLGSQASRGWNKGRREPT